ncbi:hypothetical protein LDENG_00144520 [Lucifuga dentata]|nr:hypothetical protein LDENG_00144520 [Lucifuga dentata]
MQSSFLLHVVLATLMVIFSNEQDVIAGHSGLSPAPAEEGRIRVMAVWEDADSLGVPKFTGRTRRDTTEGKVRRKRSWIFPGTLWCGTGSKAMAYEQLGMFESTDRCCREHDHCKHMIPAFTVNYGVFNPNFFTVSHCDCDQRFRQCLFHVNDTISSMVGYSFFNILRVPCIEFIQQTRCIHMYWWGTCKVVKEALQAIFKKPLPYNSSDIISNSWEGEYNMSTIIEGQHGRERPLISPNRKSPNRKSPKAQPQRINKTTESPKRQTTKTLRNTATTAMTIKTTNKTGLLMQTADSLHQDGKPQKQKDSFAEWDNSSQEITENQLLCRSLRYLDECKYKIPPLEKKYDRHNMESKTAYHCDCTSRLAAQIESFRRPSILPSLLKDFVSQNCFSLPTEKKCHYRKSCSGGFTKASDLLQALKKIEEKDAGVQNSGNDRKRGIPVRLYKRCLRIVDSWRRG